MDKMYMKAYGIMAGIATGVFTLGAAVGFIAGNGFGYERAVRTMPIVEFLDQRMDELEERIIENYSKYHSEKSKVLETKKGE